MVKQNLSIGLKKELKKQQALLASFKNDSI